MAKKTTNKLAWIVLITGLFSFVMAWLIEINFHYYQDFQGNLDPELTTAEIMQLYLTSTDVFWRAERAITLPSMTFLIMGIILIIIGIYSLWGNWLKKSILKKKK